MTAAVLVIFIDNLLFNLVRRIYHPMEHGSAHVLLPVVPLTATHRHGEISLISSSDALTEPPSPCPHNITMSIIQTPITEYFGIKHPILLAGYVSYPFSHVPALI